MYLIALVGLGGAAGSILRFLLQRALNTTFPYGTMLVNLIGCFLVGVLWGILYKHFEQEKTALLIIGFCGGFTTFSAFSLDGLQMMMENRWLAFFSYVSVSVLIGLILTFIGFKITS